MAEVLEVVPVAGGEAPLARLMAAAAARHGAGSPLAVIADGRPWSRAFRPGRRVKIIEAAGGLHGDGARGQDFGGSGYLSSSNNAEELVKEQINSRFGLKNLTWREDAAQNWLTLIGKKASNLWFEDVVRPIMAKFGQTA
jgi:hypothetical protein